MFLDFCTALAKMVNTHCFTENHTQETDLAVMSQHWVPLLSTKQMAYVSSSHNGSSHKWYINYVKYFSLFVSTELFKNNFDFREYQ